MNTEELQQSYGDPVRLKGWGENEETTRAASKFFEAAMADRRNSYERVREFHETFGHPVADEPTTIADERYVLRLALILEEAIELADALGFPTDDIKDSADYMLNKIGPRIYDDKVDIVAVADALGDLEYVVNGAALEMGIPLPAVVEEIHRSNMTKLGPDGKPIYRADGKILKGEDYEPPNLQEVLGF